MAETTTTEPYRTYLREDQIPTAWYNLRADMPEKPEPMRLPNGKVATVDDIAPVFARALCEQELDDDTAYFDIPEPVMEMYRVYRPSPLCRAYNLERALGTPAKIYYKFEGNNTSGSHKLNSALAQAYYAYAEGITNITTETGAGQWGTALSEAAAHFGLNLDVYMVKCSYEQKPFRRSVMQTFGATITPSPSDLRHHRGRPQDPGGRPRVHRVAGHGHQRGGGARAQRARQQGSLPAGQRAEPGAAAPVRHRSGVV